MADSLKEFITDNQSEKSGSSNNPKYNNLKLDMDIVKDKNPHIIINVGMSEGIFNLKSCEKINGSLGPDERYVQKWLNKSSVIEDLQAIWDEKVKNRGKANAND